MLRIKCIYNKVNPASLTKGKVYTARYYGHGMYQLKDDLHDGKYLYPVTWFKKAHQWEKDEDPHPCT